MHERDLAKKPFTKSEVADLLKGRDAQDFINPKSIPFKNLGLDLKTLTRDEIIDLLAKEVNLFKRPCLILGQRVIFGFSQAEYEKLSG
jgi:arsenate reductase-like glutaredoxin family protein